KEQLARLGFDGVIIYEPRKEEPQVMLTRPRIKTSLLTINQERYRERKTVFAERVTAMIRYTTSETDCRSKMIGNYFSDPGMQDCGICDNCQKKRKADPDKETFQQIISRLADLLKQPLSANELLMRMKDFPGENIWTVLH